MEGRAAARGVGDGLEADHLPFLALRPGAGHSGPPGFVSSPTKGPQISQEWGTLGEG